jgi:hypothetical protein
MEEQLVNLLKERAGLDQAQAEKAVHAILGFLKENPEKLTSLLGDNMGGLGKLFGR